MKNKLLTTISVLFSVLMLAIIVSVMSFISANNKLIGLQEDVNQAQAKVETSLQRRYDLMPNVVSSVKGYMSHEKELFEQIADARSKIGSSSKTTQSTGQSELDSAISRLLVIKENYPELKSDKHVSELMSELEGSENRIFVARNDFNVMATTYNKSIRQFPTSIVANMQGYHKVDLYQSQEEAKVAPKVNLD